MRKFLILFLLCGLVLGAAMLAGCGSKDTADVEMDVADTAPGSDASVPGSDETLSPTDGTLPDDVESGTRKGTAEEQLIYDYYAAINEGRYEDAWRLTVWSRNPGSSFEEYASFLKEHLRSVKVVSIEILPEFSTPERPEFEVTFDADYIKPFPAGSGKLEPFHILMQDPENPGEWLIEATGTGP